MANKQIMVDVGFNTNTSGLKIAEKELHNIQKSLNQISVTGKLSKGMDDYNKGLREAGQTASKLYDILEKSYSAQLGTVNVTKFKQELDKAGLSVKTLKQDLVKAGPEGAAAFARVGSALLNTNVQIKKTNTLLDEMAQSMANTVKWGITSSIFNNISNSVQDAFHYVKQLDSSLNDIRIVTDKSAESMAKFAVQANNAAKNLGASTRDYTDASLIYYQQGLAEADVQARAETTLKAANVTGQNTAEVSEQLTAVWNGYKVSAQEAELYVDKLAAVAATTASDLEELSTGMSKVASAASIMGVDIDSLNAQLATIVSVTRQAPESVGTALKTIYARMGDIEAGVDTETTLGNYTAEMEAMGFNVLDANGKLRDMGDVIEEIGGKWTTMSREQQIALSQTMAGTRQYNNLLSLFDNWDMYTEALNTSAEAAGTLQHQQDIYMESTAAHLQQLSTSVEDIFDTLIEPEEINAIIDVFRNGTDVLGTFFDVFGGGVKSMTAGAAVLSGIFSKQIGEGLGSLVKKKTEGQQNVDRVRMNEKWAREQADLKGDEASSEDVSAVARYEKERAIAEQILAVQKGITNEQYQQRIQSQDKIGQLEEEKALIKENFKKDTEVGKYYAAEWGENFDKEIFGDVETQSDFLESLNKKVEDLTNECNSAEQAMKSLNKEIGNTNTESEDVLEQIIKDYNEQEKIYKQKKKELEEAQKHYDDTKKAQDAYNQTDQEQRGYQAGLNIELEEDEKLANIANTFDVIGNSAEIATLAIGGFVSIIDIINNEDLTFGEKLGQGLLLAATTIPMMVSSFQTLKAALAEVNVFTTAHNALIKIGTSGNVENAASEFFQAIAKKKTTEEINKQSVALKGESAEQSKNTLSNLGTAGKGLLSVFKSIPPQAWIVAAAIAAVGIACYAAYKESIKYDEALKQAKKTQGEVNNNLQEAKTSYEETISAISNYNTAADALEGLTKGTREWNEAVLELNGNVLSLMEKYPELAGYITNNNGILEISEEGLNQVIDQEAKKVKKAQQSAYVANANVANAENQKAIYDDFKLKGQTDGQVYDYSGHGANVEKIIDLINSGQEGLLFDTKNLAQELGTTEWDAELYKENSAAIMELATQLAANEQIIDANNQLLADSLLEEDKEYSNLSEDEQQIASKLIASQMKDIEQLSTKSAIYRKGELNEIDFLKGQNDIEDAIKVLEALGKNADDYDIKNAGGGTFEYRKSGTDDEFVKLNYKDYIDQVYANEQSKKIVDEFNIEGLTQSFSKLDKEVGLTTSNIISKFIATGGELSNLSQIELKAVREALKNGDLSAGVIESAFSKEQLAELGYESGESLVQSLNDSLSTENMFKDIFNKTFTQAGEDGTAALNNVLEGVDENLYSKLSFALNQIDWNSNHAMADLNEILEQQGISLDITTQAWKDYIAEMQRGAGIVGADILKSNQQEVAGIIGGLDIGSTISGEDFEKIKSQSASAANLFVEQLDGTYKLVTSQGNLAEHFFGDFETQAQRNIELLKQIQDLASKGENQQNWQDSINQTAQTAASVQNHGAGYDEKGHTIQAYKSTEDGQAIVEAAMASQGVSQDELSRSIFTLDSYQNQDYESLGEEAKNQVNAARAVVDGIYDYIDQTLNDPESLDKEIQTNKETIAATHTSSSSLDASFAQTAANTDATTSTLEDLEVQGDALRGLASEYESCADELEAYNKILETQSEDSEDARKAYKELNKAVKQAEWKKMAKDVSKSVSEIKKLTKGTAEYDQKAQEIANSINKAFGTNVTKDFYEENQELMDEWANSTGEKASELTMKIQELAAIDSMQNTDINFDITANDQVTSKLASLQEKQAALKSIIEANPITINAQGQADMSQLIAGLSQAGASAEWVAKYLASIGHTNISISTDNLPTQDIDLSSEEGITQFMEMWNQANGAGLNVTGQVPDVAPSMSSGGSGGGGGGGAKPQTAQQDKDKFKPEIDPFHEVNEQLDLMAEKLDRLSQKQEKAFGKDLINNLEAQNKILTAQNKNLDTKIKITDKELKQDKKQLKNFKIDGKKLKTKVKFNKDGSVANYDETLASAAKQVEKLRKQYNKEAKKKYTKDSKEDKAREKLKTRLDKAKERYDKLEELLDEYDSYLVDKEELLNEKQANIDQMIENNIEIFTIPIEIKLEVSDIKEDYNNFLKDWESLTAEKPIKLEVDTIKDNANLALGNIEYLTTMVTQAQTELAKIQKGETSSLFGDNEQAAYETLKDYTTKLQDELSKIPQYYEDAAAAVTDAMDAVSDAMAEKISDMEFYSDSIQHMINVNEKLYGEDKAAGKNKDYYKNLVTQSNALVTTLKGNADYWKSEMNSITDKNSEAYKIAKENYISATQDMQAALETALENIQLQLEQNIKGLFIAFEEGLSPDNWNVDTMTSDWEMAVEESERYLNNIDKANQLKQLELKYQQAIDKSSSLSTQKELLALKQEELNVLKEQGKLTQYDIDRANKKLQLKLAEMALEEAQNNKSKMRLRRDSQGNYSYQYVADQDNIAEKQAAVDNLKAEMANDDFKHMKDVVSQYLGDESDFAERYAELAANGATDAELKEFQENYISRLVGQGGEFSKAWKYLTESTAAATGKDLGSMSDEEKLQMLKDNYGADIIDSQALVFLNNLTKNLTTTEEATKNLNEALFTKIDAEREEAEKAKARASAAAGYGENFEAMSTALNSINAAVTAFNTESDTTITNLKAQLDGVQGVFDIIKTFLNDEKVKAGLKTLKSAIGTDKDVDGNKVTSDGSLSAAGSDEQSGTVGDTSQTEDVKKDIEEQSKQGNGKIEKNDIVTILLNAQNQNPTKWKKSGDKMVKQTKKEGKKTVAKKFKAGTQAVIEKGPEVYDGKTYYKLKNSGWINKTCISGYDTGGYTGDWKSSEGRLAFLHQKELVLNAKDTENMLKMLDISRSMTSVISSVSNKIKDMMYQIDKANYIRNMNSRTQLQDASNQLEQNVHIEATFPNVSQSHEIEDAFNNLINIAAQRAYRPKR